jgi:hypothetical protein
MPTPMESDDFKILQIIPASDWYAVYFSSTRSIEAKVPKFFSDPLSCWALMEDDEKTRYVEGLVAVADDWQPRPAAEGCSLLPLKEVHPENDNTGVIFIGFALGKDGVADLEKRHLDQMTDEMRRVGWL